MPVHGWNGESKVFKVLIEKVRPTTIIEVGSWHGQSAITMGNAIKELGLDTKIYCVDTWLGSLEFMSENAGAERHLEKKEGYPQVFYTFMKNIKEAGLEDIIIPIPQTSHIASLWFAKNNITADLIYLDASHQYEDVKRDISDYLPLCTGVLFGDDYSNKEFEVKEAVLDSLDNIDLIENNFWIYDIHSSSNH